MKLYILTILSFLSLVSFGQQKPLKLWYTSPSEEVWENALPLGNGKIGVMVYGNVPNEIYELNEHTVWSGSPNKNLNESALFALPEVRKLLFAGKYKEAENLANQKIITKKSNGQIFQPVGKLQVDFKDQANFSDYYRELDIEEATSKVTYKVDGVSYTREAFTSLTDGVLVVQYTADKPNSISFSTTFSSPHQNSKVEISPLNDLILSGTTSTHEGVEGKVKFKSIARINNLGGQVYKEGNVLHIENATSVVIYLSIASNFINYQDISGDENLKASKELNNAAKWSFKTLKDNHVKTYKNLYDRVKIDLGETNLAEQPTDLRLKEFKAGFSPSFISLYYQFGRYLLISSSQPGGQPANLQGIWNNKLMPPWDSKYTININTEMNYWPAEKTNLAETHEPLIQMVKELSETGKETAQVMYGAKGWVAHHNTDIWRVSGPVDAAFYGIWNGGGAWLSQHLWEKYLYNGNNNYLISVYPILKGAAQFYADFLVEEPTHKWLVVAPGSSPENAPIAHEKSSITVGSTMDNQLVFDVFSNAIRAAKVLETDKVFSNHLVKLRKRLPPMQIGQYGQLQEWLDDVDDPKDKHRHISHLYGLYPSNQVNAYTTPELFAAARNTLIQRGDVSTGWSMGWKVNWWAKMQDGDKAYKLIQDQLTPAGVNPNGGGTYNNLFDAHPPFQMTGNLGCTSGITEMLMQSSDGAIHLLPALPLALSAKGSISGLRAKGGFDIVTMEWENGKITKLIIKSNLGGNLRLRTPNSVGLTIGLTTMEFARGDNPNPFFYTENIAPAIISPKSENDNIILRKTKLYDMKTRKGIIYTFRDTSK